MFKIILCKNKLLQYKRLATIKVWLFHILFTYYIKLNWVYSLVLLNSMKNVFEDDLDSKIKAKSDKLKSVSRLWSLMCTL